MQGILPGALQSLRIFIETITEIIIPYFVLVRACPAVERVAVEVAMCLCPIPESMLLKVFESFFF